MGPAASSLEESRGEGSSGSALSAQGFKEEPQQEGDPAPQNRNRGGGIGTCKGTGIGDWKGTGQGGWGHRAEGLRGAQGGSAREAQGGSKARGKSQALLEEADQELREGDTRKLFQTRGGGWGGPATARMGHTGS